MAQITIELPDDLVEQLGPYEKQLPEIVTRFIAATLLKPKIGNGSESMSNGNKPEQLYQEILDLLISQPSPEVIMGFRVSEGTQSRLQSLLQKNRESALTPGESAELDLYEQLDTVMGLLKVRAYKKLRPSQAS